MTNIIQSRKMIYSIQAQYAAHGIGRWAVLLQTNKELWTESV